MPIALAWSGGLGDALPCARHDQPTAPDKTNDRNISFHLLAKKADHYNISYMIYMGAGQV
jgi:hypothetical protein